MKNPASKRSLVSIAALFFLYGAGFANWQARLPSVRDKLNVSHSQLGLVLLACGLGSLLSFRFAGRLMMRFGSRDVCKYSGLAFSLCLIGPTLATTPIWAAVALFILGIASGLLDVGMNTQGVEAEVVAKRAILSKLHGVFSLGCLCGAMTGTAAARANLSISAHLGLVALVMVPIYLLASKNLVVSPQDITDAPAVKMTRAMVLLGAVAFCSSVGEGAMGNWSALYLTDNLHTSDAVGSVGLTISQLAMVIGRFLGDRITHGRPASVVISKGGLLVALGLSFGLIINTISSVLFGYLCVGLGLSVIIPVVFRATSKLKGASPAGALATVATLSYGGFLLGTPTIGVASESYGLRPAFFLVVVLALVLSALGRKVPG